MAEMMAENYHNIWAKKKKMELEAKGNINYKYLQYFKISMISLGHVLEKTDWGEKKRNSKFKVTKKQQSIYS